MFGSTSEHAENAPACLWANLLEEKKIRAELKEFMPLVIDANTYWIILIFCICLVFVKDLLFIISDLKWGHTHDSRRYLEKMDTI